MKTLNLQKLYPKYTIVNNVCIFIKNVFDSSSPSVFASAFLWEYSSSFSLYIHQIQSQIRENENQFRSNFTTSRFGLERRNGEVWFHDDEILFRKRKTTARSGLEREKKIFFKTREEERTFVVQREENTNWQFIIRVIWGYARKKSGTLDFFF